jgi:hypothetical protein
MKIGSLKNKRTLLILLLVLSGLVNAQQSELTGFFDVLSVHNNQDGSAHEFMVNQFELDVSYAHKSNFTVGTALAYNSEMENIELAMAFVHYSFDDSPGKHPRREEAYDHSAIQIGKFDMPFGLDYLSYASIDRPTVTQPLVVEKTIRGWNDVGIDFHTFNGNFKFDIWAVNGFDEGIGLGGNIRYTFFSFLELGISHSSDIVEFKERKDWLSGFDLHATVGNFNLKSEYIWMKGVFEGERDTLLANDRNHGVYFQLLTELKEWTALPMFVTLRYGAWESEYDRDEDGIDDCQNRYTAAIGYNVGENISIRAEIVSNQIDNGDRENQGFLQFVVGF